jgi:copper chaperone
MDERQQHTYNVTGMSCQHCAAAVEQEVGVLAGVSEVDVDLASGALVVHGRGVSSAAVRAAVETAGYSLAPDA